MQTPYDVIIGCGLSVIDVTPSGDGMLAFKCFCGPATAKAGGIQEAFGKLLTTRNRPVSWLWADPQSREKGYGTVIILA